MTDTKYILVGSALFNWSETQRMIEISDELNRRGYKIVFIGEGKYDYLLDTKNYVREYIDYDSTWYTPKRISMMLRMDQYGSNFATSDEVEKIISAEINVIKKYNPVAILTGYRMTLTISAKVCQIPIIWSLSATLSKPYLEVVAEKTKQINKIKRDSKQSYESIRALFEDKIACERLLGECKTSDVWNDFLVKNLCEPLSCDLDIYTGDLNLMSDAKTLFPEIKEDRRYRFIGPLLNNQIIEMPEIVKSVLNKNHEKKRVLISIGSAGKKELLLKILEATLGFDCDFFVSVIGALSENEIKKFPENYYFCEKYPLIEIAQKCDVSIIQGGQGTLYAMIVAKCPFVSLPAFFEQRKNIENVIKSYKCGEIIRNYNISSNTIQLALSKLLSDAEYKNNIIRAANDIEEYTYNRNQSSITAADFIEDMLNMN